MVSFPFLSGNTEEFEYLFEIVPSMAYSTFLRKKEDERKEGSLKSFEEKYFFFKENELLTSVLNLAQLVPKVGILADNLIREKSSVRRISLSPLRTSIRFNSRREW